MRAARLLDAQSAELLGFKWLVTAVAPLSPYGARLFAGIEPFAPGQEAAAQARASQIARGAAQLSRERVAEMSAALDAVADVSGAVARASLGETLEDADLLELRRFCEALERLDLSAAATRALGELLAIGRTAGAEFYLADAFDEELAAKRAELARTQAGLDAVLGRERAAVAAALHRDDVPGDEFIVMRAELAGSLPQGVRVVREAPTYLLCALENAADALDALARRDGCARDVAAHEERVRARLSASVAQWASELGAAAVALAELDVTLGAVRFTQRYRCNAPEIVAESGVAFEAARFLPLEGELRAAGRAFAPIDLALRGAAVLTGPNMGGKSVTLQTCGFVALLGAFGLPVPAASARVALFDEIAWLGLGREERGPLLSSFALELVALREVLARASGRLLLLADEFARTTTPHEGRALVVALLSRMRERQADGLVATHLQGIARDAGVAHFAVRGLHAIPPRCGDGDLNDALRRLAAAMDYRIVRVAGDEAPQADAIALAELLGVDAAFVEAAYRALSQ